MRNKVNKNAQRLLYIEDGITNRDIYEYETCMFDTCTVCNYDQREKCRKISEKIRG